MVKSLPPWRRKWQPSPVFLPGKSHEQKSVVSYSPWGLTKSDTIECTRQEHILQREREKWSQSESCSVVSDSVWPHGLYSPWNSPGQNTGVGGLFPKSFLGIRYCIMVRCLMCVCQVMLDGLVLFFFCLFFMCVYFLKIGV